MSHTYELELRGCTPEPLMAYLKALGIFRSVSEQKDANARAWWKNDTFFLRSTLDHDALLEFFLEEYRPTPIVSPWNGGSGFYPKGNSTAVETINAVRATDSPRMAEYRQTVRIARQILDDMGIDEKPSKDKTNILAKCRNLLPDFSIDWLDAAYVLTSNDPVYTPILGTGGNDGRLDFSIHFMSNSILAMTGMEIGKKPSKRVDPEKRRKGWLETSLFDEGNTPLVNRPVGQFNPGGAGGSNASSGFQGGAMLDPWDYVLMFEGALLFAGAAARRLSQRTSTKAVFPFTVDNSAAGYGTSTDSEYGGASRAEFWAPIWDRPANLDELSHLVSEGRAQLGRRQVASGTDFARAVAGLGTERGINQFQRYGFMVRNGLSYLAAPLGRFYIRNDRDTAQRANVLFDLDSWLESLRRNTTGSSPPAGLGTAMKRIETSIIDFCQRGRPQDLQNVLVEVGHMERWLAKSSIGDRVRPLNSLSRDWLEHADDGSPEFRLARSLASILREPPSGEQKIGPIRENLEPVDTGRGVTWNASSTSFVWNTGDPLSNMLAVLDRRVMDGQRRGIEGGHPPLDSYYSARLRDITDFLNDDVDIQRVADLALPLSFIRHSHRRDSNNANMPRRQLDAPFALPPAYATMKLTLLPRMFECEAFGIGETTIRAEPRMLALLRAGRIHDAYEVAYRRLVSSGLQPLSADPGIKDRSELGRRLAAALLFPLDKTSNKALAQRALRKPIDKQESESESDSQTEN